jgi:hypothetical protein
VLVAAAVLAATVMLGHFILSTRKKVGRRAGEYDTQKSERVGGCAPGA